MKKKTFYTECAYLCGLIGMAFGNAFLTHAGFGLSMIVAPAYLLHLKISETLPFFTFGVTDYLFQGVLLLVMVLLLRRFRLSYLFAFVTAVISGYLMDFAIWILGFLPVTLLSTRIVFFLLGLVLVPISVTMMYHTYITPKVYEYFVKQVSGGFHIAIHKFKLGYDWICCAVSVLLSFLFFGFGTFIGINVGTFVSAAINGPLIGKFSAYMDRTFEFKDALPAMKRVFVKSAQSA